MVQNTYLLTPLIKSEPRDLLRAVSQPSQYASNRGVTRLRRAARAWLDPAVVREVHEGFYANVPAPNPHYSFCEGGSFVTEPGNVSDPLTDVAIADHITGDPAHALRWSGRFEMFREAPAEGAAFVGAMSECCEGKAREFGFVTRASGGTFRTTVDALGAESVDEGRRCHAPP